MGGQPRGCGGGSSNDSFSPAEVLDCQQRTLERVGLSRDGEISPWLVG